MICSRIWIIILLVFAHLQIAAAQDAENCVLCHSLPNFARVDEQNELRILEVDMSTFSLTSHARIACGDCHEDIRGFPHPEQVQKVDCGKICHVNKPYTLSAFSHRLQVEQLAGSIHGQNPEHDEQRNAAKPTCKYCHGNRLYEEPATLIKRVNRCQICHLKEGLKRVLSHVDRLGELHNSETSQDIVSVCSSCHANESKMIEADVNPSQVSGFQHHFHGKALRRGQDDVAHCADCHSGHGVLPADNPRSTLSTANIQQTCASCHERATFAFSKSAVHSKPTPENSPLVYYIEMGFIVLTTATMALLFTHILLDFNRWLVGVLVGRRKRNG